MGEGGVGGCGAVVDVLDLCGYSGLFPSAIPQNAIASNFP